MVGTFPKNYNIGLSITGKVDVVANTPIRQTYYYSILFEEVDHPPIWISKDLLPSCPYGFLRSRSPTFYLMFQISNHIYEWVTLAHQGEHQKRSAKCLSVDHPDFMSLAPPRVKSEKVLSSFASTSSITIHHGSKLCYRTLDTDVGKTLMIMELLKFLRARTSVRCYRRH